MLSPPLGISTIMTPHFKDPRTQPDFQPDLFPTCNLQPCPSSEIQDRESAIMRSAAAAYYDINQLLKQILEASQSSDQATKQALLRQIKQANEKRNALAEQLESEGLEIRPQLRAWKTVHLVLVESLKRFDQESSHQPAEYFDVVIPIEGYKDPQSDR